MTAQFLTQTQVAKEAIESQVQILRETLEQQGLILFIRNRFLFFV